MKKSSVLAYKVNPVVRFIRNFITTTVFLSYYVWVIWIFQTSAKISKAECNRIEPKYVICQQTQLNLSRSLKPKVTSFRLFNAVVGSISGQVSGFSYNSEQSDGFQWLENSYGIYLETNEKLLLLGYGHSSLPKAQKAEDYVNQYIQGHL